MNIINKAIRAISDLSQKGVTAKRVAGGTALVAGYEMARPEESDAMLIGPSAKIWDKVTRKFSSVPDRSVMAEIPDKGARLINPLPQTGAEPVPLSSVYRHKALSKAYPTMMENMRIQKRRGNTSFYRGSENLISVADEHAPLETILHELQHAVQAREGWSSGEAIFGATIAPTPLLRKLSEMARPKIEAAKESIKNVYQNDKLRLEKIDKLSDSAKKKIDDIAGEIDSIETRMGNLFKAENASTQSAPMAERLRLAEKMEAERARLRKRAHELTLEYYDVTGMEYNAFGMDFPKYKELRNALEYVVKDTRKRYHDYNEDLAAITQGNFERLRNIADRYAEHEVYLAGLGEVQSRAASARMKMGESARRRVDPLADPQGRHEMPASEIIVHPYRKSAGSTSNFPPFQRHPAVTQDVLHKAGQQALSPSMLDPGELLAAFATGGASLPARAMATGLDAALQSGIYNLPSVTMPEVRKAPITEGAEPLSGTDQDDTYWQ